MVEYLPPAGRIALAHHGRIEGCKPVGRKEYVADLDGGRPAGVMSQKSQCPLPGPVQGLPWAGSVSVALKVFWFLACLLSGALGFWFFSSFIFILFFIFIPTHPFSIFNLLLTFSRVTAGTRRQGTSRGRAERMVCGILSFLARTFSWSSG